MWASRPRGTAAATESRVPNGRPEDKNPPVFFLLKSAKKAQDRHVEIVRRFFDFDKSNLFSRQLLKLYGVYLYGFHTDILENFSEFQNPY